MPIYDFKCQICRNIRSIRIPISDDPYVECCGVEMRQVFLDAPAGSISPTHRAVKDKLSYYGVKNAITGEGITKDTDVSEGLGIKLGPNLEELDV